MGLTCIFGLHLAAVGCDEGDDERRSLDEHHQTSPDALSDESLVGASTLQNGPPSPEAQDDAGEQTDAPATSCIPDDVIVPVVLHWEHLAGAKGPVSDVPADSLELVARNQTDKSVSLQVRFVIDTGKQATHETEPIEVEISAADTTSKTLDLTTLDLPIAEMNTSGMILAIASVTDTDTGDRLLGAVSPPLFWHYGTPEHLDATAAAGTLTVYDEATLSASYSGGDVMGLAPADAFDAPGDGTPAPRVSRVFIGNDVGIVTQGRTTPQDLVDMGLLQVIEPVIDEKGGE